MQLTRPFLALASSLALLGAVASTPVQPERRDTSVVFDGRTFVNKGLVAFGRVSGDAKDSYGESLGGFGSAIALESFKKQRDGTYVASLRAQPDRGYNVIEQTDYRARQHKLRLVLNPAAASNGTENIQTTYESTTLYSFKPAFFNGDRNFTTGLDPIAVRPAAGIQPSLPLAPSNNHISFDTEGLALDTNGDGAWISDEYGPHIHYISRHTGQIKSTIAPPRAILPYHSGVLNFTSNTEPTTGRSTNQGFEGLTLDRNTDTLWACTQSAVAQDGGGSKATNRHARLLGYNVKNPARPRLVAEYIVPLPQSSKGNTRAQSEIHVVDSTTFLILARDGNGFGDSSSDSTFKSVDLISTKGATNIANTKYDDPANPAAPGGKLNADITPVAYTSFVNLIQPAELAKFGLHVGGAFDRGLIAAKLESLALAPTGDAAGEFFLFVVSDNDFVTNKGAQAAQAPNGSYVVAPFSDPYAEQYGTADTQIFVWRVTLPGYNQKPLPN
ncbi:hypothetical protein OC842_002740 [Tilletia horrida]|uniref:Phytase-like domain-containing protein n=1 Tax=Tilletia horrida TaxID=155126 RepID=A0AAN6JKW1_9BASI|nr:hypothetical protein OC842_002740 [Tilletia horrida]